MRCEEIMKKTVECVGPKETLLDAARKMRDDNIGFLPVCDDGGKAIGTLTDRDIVVRACADDQPAGKTPVADVMTREVVACRANDEIGKALELMKRHHKSRMLCTDERGDLVGVISLSDIARYAEEEGAKTLREVSGRESRP